MSKLTIHVPTEARAVTKAPSSRKPSSSSLLHTVRIEFLHNCSDDSSRNMYMMFQHVYDVPINQTKCSAGSM